MRQLKIMFMGCGFLATHMIPHVIPYTSHFFLIDRERIEKVNYDNSIFPKNYVGKRKVGALASFIQILTPTPVTPIHINIKNEKQLEEIYKEHKPEFVIVTFDNIEARNLAKNFFMGKVPAMFIGVTENYIYIDWAKHIALPSKKEDIEKINESLSRIRDVCTRIEFRGLGVLSAGYAYHSFTTWLEKGNKIGYIISVKDDINSVQLRR